MAKITAVFSFSGKFKGWNDNSMMVQFYPIGDKDGKYKEYFEATPSGSLKMVLSAKAEAVQAMFEREDVKQGKLYRMTLEEIVD